MDLTDSSRAARVVALKRRCSPSASPNWPMCHSRNAARVAISNRACRRKADLERPISSPIPYTADLVSRKHSSMCIRRAYIATISSGRYALSLGECASSHGSCALARASLAALGVEP